MSWRVDGKYYHDYNEYQRALAHKREQESQALVQTLENELNEAQRQNERVRNELSKAQGDFKAQQKANARLEQNQKQIQRLQKTMQEAQQRLQKDVKSMDQRHQQDLQRVYQNMDALEARTQAEQRALQRSLDEAQARLGAEIQQVERRLEQDLAQRQATQSNQLARALLQAEASQEWIRNLSQTQLETLDLSGELSEIQGKLVELNKLTEADSQAALGLGIDIYQSSRSLYQESQRREALMEASQEALLRDCQYLENLVQNPTIERFFKEELGLFTLLLNQLKHRAETAYGVYRELSVQEREDQRLLNLLRRQAYRMAASVEAIEEQFERRTEAVKKIVLQDLPQVFGALSNKPEQQYLRQGDLKSPLQVRCDFGGSKLQLVADLEGGLHLDGYGYESNVTCRQQGEQLFGLLQQNYTEQNQPVYSADNRQQALPGDVIVPDEWREIQQDLQAEIEQYRRGQR